MAHYGQLFRSKHGGNWVYVFIGEGIQKVGLPHPVVRLEMITADPDDPRKATGDGWGVPLEVLKEGFEWSYEAL